MDDHYYDVFISYDFVDERDALWIRDVLTGARLKTFMAVADLGVDREKDESWSERIVDIISRSRIMVVLASPDSVRSNWVKHEWQTVHRNLLNDRAMPATIITCCVRDIPPEQLEGSLRAFEILDLRPHNRRPEMTKRLLDIVDGYLKREEPVPRRNTTSILSIEGGGVRSLVAGRVLVALEEKIRRVRGESARLADCFDLIAGVSSGCILAALLAHKEMSAAEAVSRYRAHLPGCFERNPLYPFEHKYQSRALEEALISVLGETRLSQLATPCLIPAYDLINRKPLLLGRRQARENPAYDLSVVDAVMAAVALPTFFEPREVRFPNRLQALLVDACLFAKDPTDLAYEEACNMHHPRPRAEELCILSLGTGIFPTTDKSPRHWNLLNWLNEMLGIAMNGSSDLIHSTFSRMYQSLGLRHRYLRIDLDAEKTRGRHLRVDDTTPEALDELERIGDELTVEFDGKLEEFVGLIIEPN